MNIGAAGKALIEEVEGRRAKMYLDSAGLPSIGIGHLIKPNERWMLTATLTDAQIDGLFITDIAWAEEATSRLFPNIKAQNKFDALLSFVFNFGESKVKGYTLTKLINDGASEADVRAKWAQYAYSGGVMTPGLVTRRKKEVDLFYA